MPVTVLLPIFQVQKNQFCNMKTRLVDKNMESDDAAHSKGIHGAKRKLRQLRLRITRVGWPVGPVLAISIHFGASMKGTFPTITQSNAIKPFTAYRGTLD